MSVVSITTTTMDPMRWDEVVSAAASGEKWYFRLECKEGKSNKFWEASGEGTGDCVVAFGRIGTVGSMQPRPFAYVKKKRKEKVRKGYHFVMKSGGGFVPIAEKPSDEEKRQAQLQKEKEQRLALQKQEEREAKKREKERTISEMISERRKKSSW